MEKQSTKSQNKSILLESIQIISVSGKAKTKNKAIENAFEKMKLYIYKNYNNLIVSIETLDIFKSEKNNKKVQKDKIIFNDVQVFLDIKVKVKYIKEGGI